MMTSRRLPSLVFAAILSSGDGVSAEDAVPSTGLTVEINEVAPSERGCKLTFVAGNAMAKSLANVSFEFVLFDRKGLVERMAVLDFRDLPAGKTKVRQFDLAGTKCEDVGSLLINDAPVCLGDGVAKDACMAGLKTGSKAAVDLKG